MKYVKSINLSALEEKNEIYPLNKRPFIEWSFCFYIKKLKSSKLITRYKPSIYLRLFHINQISQNKGQKSQKFLL